MADDLAGRSAKPPASERIVWMWGTLLACAVLDIEISSGTCSILGVPALPFRRG